MSDALRSTLISARCLLRRAPMFVRATPKTPLRVLGVVAFDTLHVLRTSRPLSPTRALQLATFLDFEGCANAEWDHKRLCRAECRLIRERLEDAGLGACIDEYLSRLRQLESTRPTPGGDQDTFAEVREYRAAVARLSLSTAAAIALNVDCRPAHLNAPLDDDVETLFLILMLCQIVDDVLDYDEDVAAGLPSFLTAPASLTDALDWTAETVRAYASPTRQAASIVLPFRVALRLFALAARLVIVISRGAHQTVKTHAPQRP